MTFFRSGRAKVHTEGSCENFSRLLTLWRKYEALLSMTCRRGRKSKRRETYIQHHLILNKQAETQTNKPPYQIRDWYSSDWLRRQSLEYHVTVNHNPKDNILYQPSMHTNTNLNRQERLPWVNIHISGSCKMETTILVSRAPDTDFELRWHNGRGVARTTGDWSH